MGFLRTVATMEDRPFRAGLDRMDRDVKGFDARLRGIRNTIGAAFAVGGLTSFLRSVAQMGSEISDLSTQTGVGARKLQGLIAAVEDAGGKQENLLPVLSKLQTAMGRVSRGEAAELEKAFAALGISAESLAGLSVDQVLEQVARGFVEANRSAEAFSAVTQLLGEDQGPRLVEVLNRLATEGLDEITRAAEEAGLVMSDRFLGTLDRVEDTLNRIKRQSKVATASLWELAEAIASADSLDPSLGAGPLQRIRNALESADAEYAVGQIEAAKGTASSQPGEAARAAEQRRIAKIQQEEAARAADDEALRVSFARFQKTYSKLLGLDAKGSGFDPYSGVSLSNRADELTRVGGVAGVRMDGSQRQLEIQTQVQSAMRTHLQEIAESMRRAPPFRVAGN